MWSPVHARGKVIGHILFIEGLSSCACFILITLIDQVVDKLNWFTWITSY